MIRQAVILVGGLGTRLGERTRDVPKPLLPVGGRPFLEWLVDELRRHGVTDILLLAGFRGEQVSSAMGGHAGVRVVIEPAPLGTGGALRFAADLLQERFFFLNGDSLFDINLLDLAALAPEAEGTLAVRAVPDAARYGRVDLDGNNIVGFDSRATEPGPGLINGGVAVLSRTIVNRIASVGVVSIEADIYPTMAQAGMLAGRVYQAPFIDIGVPDDLERAQVFIPHTLRRGAVVFDRDGVLNVDHHYVHRPDQVEWVEGAIAAIKAVNDAGLFAFVATNQAGVARGYYPEAQVGVLHGWMEGEMARYGAHIDAFVYSPFHPEGAVVEYRRATDCRKPGPGMILDLFRRFRVDRSCSVMIGDKQSDLDAAAAAGIGGVLFEGGNLLDVVTPFIKEAMATVARA